MDLFKQKTMKMATSFDWNCKVCKRCKGDTKRIHRNARKKLKNFDKKLLTEYQ